MSDYVNDEVIWMLKNGRSAEEIKDLLSSEDKKSYSYEFVDFMQDMLDKYQIKRTEIARATGISQDYLYKILNGSKKTSERDYILAICLAAGMNFPETQHALEICQLHLLDGSDIRDHIISESITGQRGVYRTNDWIEKAGYPPLRVSKDMELYTPNYDFSVVSENQSSHSNKRLKLHKIDEEVIAEKCGLAPFDYIYIGNITVEDQDDNRYHVQAYFHPEFTVFSTITEENYEIVKKLEDEQTEPDNDEPQWESLEEFESLDEASDSEFFRYYMETDRLTDNKVKEVLETQNDTANYGSRCNIRIDGTGMTRYAEQYDSADPAKHQYFQVKETKDGVVYSATHESIFMWMELGSIYSAFFPEREEPKYFIHIENEDELNTLSLREKFILQSLRAEMHKRLRETIGDYAGIDDNDLIDEELTTIAQHGTWAFLNGQYEESLNYNLHLLEKAKQYEKESGKNMIAVTLTTLNKIKSCYSMLGNNTEVQKYSDQILASKKELYAALEAGKSDLFGAIDSYTTELMYRSQDAQNDGDMEAVADYCKEIISLLERDENCFDCPETLFIAYTKYAYILDEENRSEEAIELYEKGELLIRKYHLEKGQYRRNVLSFYNNYAWVLWNRFQNQEAIIYYGKVIDMAEDAINEGNDMVATVDSLEHFANGLHKLYEQTGKTKEAERLEKRLSPYGITFE